MIKLKYPIGIQTFSTIREGGYVYVDKTGYLHALLDSGSRYVFLSRPRRFGKSLFLSMTEEFFKGNRKIFSGLDIDRHDYDWQSHPIFHLDLTTKSYKTPSSLTERLNSHLENWETIYGNEKADRSPEERFGWLIAKAFERTGRKAVILIDEYDKPLLDSVDDKQLQDSYRDTLRAFYGNLKSMDAFIRFAMLTGVTKFGHLSIFSDLNNLEDISMSEDYSGICGITPSELHDCFDGGVKEIALKLDIPSDEAYDLLRLNYDGYHFCPENSVDVYNPFSIMNALKDRRISNYWFQTGTPEFLVKLIRSRQLALSKLDRIEVDEDSVKSVQFDYRSSLYPVLYQTGYLTIKGYRSDVNRLILGFPNREVEQGFYTQLMRIYIPASENDSEFSIINFYDDVMGGNAERFMIRLQSILSDFNQDGFNRIDIEQHYQDVVFIIMKLMGFYTEIEYKTASGRIDLVVKTPQYIYVFEFKIDKSAREALNQINSKDYLLPFKADGRKLIKIGANFSNKIHSLSDWMIDEC